MVEFNFLGPIAGFLAAVVLFLWTDRVRRNRDEKDSRRRVILNLRDELEQNRRQPELSSYTPLNMHAWDEARTAGISSALSNEVRRSLIEVYSRVAEKNEFLLLNRLALPTGQQLAIHDAQGRNPEPLLNVLGRLTRDIGGMIDGLVPQLARILDGA